ncbi:MAG: EAL domain-containing protein [Hyphomicrobium sp.]|nr:EAL domain-containing protein [Hyphomicrobium sp.]
MTFISRLLAIVSVLVGIAASSQRAHALEAITLTPDQGRIEITTRGELYEGRGDSLQIETAANADGTTGRLSVRAVTPGTNPSWMVFALHNPTEVAVERWISADRYTIIGSGVVWPDLDARRIEALTPSIGFVPERIDSDRADLFRITLEPGQTITYVAELSSERFARIFVWKPLDYELKVRERQLFNGVMLGLTGLLAIFLTAIFAANHKVIFPAAALVAWCVLGYLCVDFGFFHKLFQLKAENNAVYRAATEASMAASLVLFLYFFLRIPLWHGLARMLFSVWIVAQLALVAVAVIDPRLASTFARLSFGVLAGAGMMVTLFLALRGQDRALALIPTWLLFVVWCFGTAVTLTGQLAGDMVVSGLVAGLVLIVLLIGFTVTQFAFKSLEPLYGTSPTELQLRSVAVEAAGAGVWEWSARRDEVKVSGAVEAALGLNPGELNTKVDDFCRHIHPADRERFRLSLVSNEERNDGQMRCVFRLRHADNSYRWFEVEASSIPSQDGRTVKSVGLLRDVTDMKRAQEHLMTDAVKCSLTGLPNKQLLEDRLAIAIQRARTEPNIRPTVLFVDVDKFKTVNASYGVVVGDSLLLTIARRIQRHLEPEDTLARASGDRFAILLLKERPAQELAGLAERVRRSLRSPIKLAGQEIVLTGSVGIAIFDGHQADDRELLREAETAMYRAKRGGADRIEIFRPEMREQMDERAVVDAEIRKAVEKNQLTLLYQPIVYMPMEELAGFEAMVRWNHPKHGLINPFGYLESEASADLLVRTVQVALAQALKDCVQWQKELPRVDNALFVNFNLPPVVKIDQNVAQDIRQTLSRHPVAKGSLKLGVPEAMVMNNPEHSGETLEWLRSAGAELVLDDFCVGYSSLIYLGRLPFDCVRIDRALLDGNNGSDATASGMLRAVTAMTHELGRKVIVQGVETDEDVGYLRSIECEYGQGFYYGDPISERDVVQLLKLVRKSERRIQPRGLFRAAVRKKVRDEAAQAADASADAAVTVSQEREAVPAMAAALAGAIGAQPPPMPAQGRAQDPVTEPLRRPVSAKAHVRPRGPMPAAASPPPPNPGSAPQFASGAEPAPQPVFNAQPPFVAPIAPQTVPPSPVQALPPQPTASPAMTAPAGPDTYPSPPFHSAANGEGGQPLSGLMPPLPFPNEAVAPQAAPGGPVAAPPPVHLSPALATTGPSAPSAPPQPRPVEAAPQSAPRSATPARPLPNYDKLPPNIAASLQRLAGVAPPPASANKPDSDAAE